MGWCCGLLVASADLLPTLPTGLQPTCSAAAPSRPSRSNVPAPLATRTTHSTLATLACRPHLPSLTPSPPRRASMRGARQLCWAAEYVFPDPIPEFAEAEVDKFRRHMMEKLSKKEDMFGTSIEDVVGICTGILSEFLHTEYGGPGTLLVIPFIDMADTINERGLPGGPQAARAAVVWAQKHVDKDWKDWTGGGNSN